jgi:hypothetical protein
MPPLPTQVHLPSVGDEMPTKETFIQNHARPFDQDLNQQMPPPTRKLTKKRKFDSVPTVKSNSGSKVEGNAQKDHPDFQKLSQEEQQKITSEILKPCDPPNPHTPSWEAGVPEGSPVWSASLGRWVIQMNMMTPDANIRELEWKFGPALYESRLHAYRSSINHAARNFYAAVATRKNVQATELHNKCIELVDYVLYELSLAGKGLDDCPNILEPENADELRETIRDKLTEAFQLRAQVLTKRKLAADSPLTLDKANVETERVQRHFRAFVYFGEKYGRKFLDTCGHAHEAQLLWIQKRCEAMAQERLSLLPENPSQRQLRELHRNLFSTHSQVTQFPPQQFQPPQFQTTQPLPHATSSAWPGTW